MAEVIGTLFVIANPLIAPSVEMFFGTLTQSTKIFGRAVLTFPKKSNSAISGGR